MMAQGPGASATRRRPRWPRPWRRGRRRRSRRRPTRRCRTLSPAATGVPGDSAAYAPVSPERAASTAPRTSKAWAHRPRGSSAGASDHADAAVRRPAVAPGRQAPACRRGPIRAVPRRSRPPSRPRPPAAQAGPRAGGSAAEDTPVEETAPWEASSPTPRTRGSADAAPQATDSARRLIESERKATSKATNLLLIVLAAVTLPFFIVYVQAACSISSGRTPPRRRRPAPRS